MSWRKLSFRGRCGSHLFGLVWTPVQKCRAWVMFGISSIGGEEFNPARPSGRVSTLPEPKPLRSGGVGSSAGTR